MAGEAWASCCGAAGLRLDCFCFFSDARVPLSGPADWEYPAVADINANESADAPNTKARECLTPKAILPRPVVFISISWVWLAGAAQECAAACWLPTFRDRLPGTYRACLGYAALRNRSIRPARTLYQL
jgi:hypothetical protein